MSSTPAYRDEPLPQNEDDHNNNAGSSNGASKKNFEPLEIADSEEFDVQHDLKDSGEPAAASAFSPLMNMIMDNERQKQETNHQYQTVGHHDDDDELDGDDIDAGGRRHADWDEMSRGSSVALDLHSNSWAGRRFYTIALVLFVLLVGAILLPKQRNRNNSGNSAFAKTCRQKLLPDTHSWQDFESKMEHAAREHSTWCGTNAGCHCNNRLEPQEHFIPDDKEDLAKYMYAVNQNHQAVRQGHDEDMNWDVLIVGDDLVERWHGVIYGTPNAQLNRNAQTFAKYFTQDKRKKQPTDSSSSNNQVTGLALGVSDDECPHLLYRLTGDRPPDAGEDGNAPQPHEKQQHVVTGLLEETNADPAVWWIVIGRNDAAAQRCAFEGILAGILNIVHVLLNQRPHATIVVNSILPDNADEEAIIEPLNQALECFAASHAQYNNRIYFEDTSSSSSQLFGTASGSGRNESLFDGAYPNALGYDLWSQRVVQRVQEITKNKKR